MTQVRKAAGLLAGELSRLDRRSGGALLSGVAPGEVYRGMLVVLMRLVFLMQAEEHGLLPAGAVTGDHNGLFGPERYPWLEKAELSDQVVRDIRAELRRAGPVTEVEQLGRVYEALLEFTCARGDGPARDLVIVAASGRRATGTHYTPRALADEVVEHTLAPLCYSPGPAEGADASVWRVRPAGELLGLTVVDPAMGSGAFLLSACRYLADRVVMAWERDGYPEGTTRDNAALEARRHVAGGCLSGVDLDELAVELSRLSLWLLTRAEDQAFSFLGHALQCGDSLTGTAFPEIMGGGGFDAVVSNPPFIGGKKIRQALGRDYREYLKWQVARGVPGAADLCAYFLLRSLALAPHGRVGIIATNTIAQGDTRRVGLDQAVAAGWVIYRAEKSRPWPGGASLEVALLWAGHPAVAESIVLNGERVTGITASLTPQSRVTGNPFPLAANAGQSYQGSIILGSGFILEPAEAQALMAQDPRNSEVIHPYLNADDLNSRWDCSASRWVINFGEMTEQEASRYPRIFAIAEERVKPVRMQKNAARYPRMVHEWWKFWNPRPVMLAATAGLGQVLVIARHSRTGLPQFVPTGQVMSDALAVFATDRPAALALLSSSLHFAWWTTMGESSLRKDARYTPSAGFDTFPQPVLTGRLDRAGQDLDRFRREVMEQRRLGLTALQRLVRDDGVRDGDVAALRELYREADEATRDAYARDEEADPGIAGLEARVSVAPLPRWADIDLGHGCHETRYGMRFTISPQARTDVLDKLLALNHYRHSHYLTVHPARQSAE
jgi:N-6 DNA Methylase